MMTMADLKALSDKVQTRIYTVCDFSANVTCAFLVYIRQVGNIIRTKLLLSEKNT